MPAELVHQPSDARSGNVTIRPSILTHEIIIDAEPGVAEQNVIRLDDLVVSVDDDRFRVSSRSRDTDILPSTRHMLNSHRAPACCRFLESVAQQGRTMLSSFDWGSPVDIPFLPRAQCGRIVLALAQWRLGPESNGPDGFSENPATFMDEISRWRTAWWVPDQIYLTRSDNRLLLDLTKPNQVDQLRAELRNVGDNGSLLVQEALPGKEHAWVSGSLGEYLSEMVVPLVQTPRRTTTSTKPRRITSNSANGQPATEHVAASREQRIRPPGSEWLFVKLYGPRSQQNDLLAGPIAAFCEMTEVSELADLWFFLRYADPEPHLRVRWRGDPNHLLRHLLPHLCEWAGELISDGLLSRFAFDSYDRELERYGGPLGMEASERVWWADSRAVVRLLGPSEVTAGDTTDLAVRTVDGLLAGLGLDETQRLEWYGTRAARTVNGGQEFRSRQRSLRSVLDIDRSSTRLSVGPASVDEILNRRHLLLDQPGTDLRSLLDREQLTEPLETILGSHVHLHHNRLLGANGSDEGLLMELLLRTRTSLAKSPLKSDPELETSQTTPESPNSST